MPISIRVTCHGTAFVRTMSIAEGGTSFETNGLLKVNRSTGGGIDDNEVLDVSVESRSYDDDQDDNKANGETERYSTPGHIVSVSASGKSSIELDVDCLDSRSVTIVATDQASVRERYCCKYVKVDTVDVQTSNEACVRLASIVAQNNVRVHARNASVVEMTYSTLCQDLYKHRDAGAYVVLKEHV